MHQYIKFLNDIANNHHHYFSVIHGSNFIPISWHDINLCLIIGVVLFIVGLFISLAINFGVGVLVSVIGMSTFMLFFAVGFIDSESTVAVSHISEKQINRCVSQAHQEYPYLITVKEKHISYDSTHHYLVANIKNDELHNVIKIHDDFDTSQPYVIKHYINPADNYSQISDSRTYLKHKVKQDIKIEKDNLLE